jgi:hypothetical protein
VRAVSCDSRESGRHAVAELTALRIAALIHTRRAASSDVLPEPIGLSVNRQGHLTLVFDSHQAVESWCDTLYGVERVPDDSVSYRGKLHAWDDHDEGRAHEITTTVVYRP